MPISPPPFGAEKALMKVTVGVVPVEKDVTVAGLLEPVGVVTASDGLVMVAGTVTVPVEKDITVAGLLEPVGVVIAGTLTVALVEGSAVVDEVAVALALLEVAPGTKVLLLLLLVPVGEVAVALLLAPAPSELTNELLELLLKLSARAGKVSAIAKLPPKPILRIL
jgi:hypothetical protein